MKISLIKLAIVLLLFCGCSMYDKGYRDGYAGKSKLLIYALSGKYHEGYNEGRYDAEMFAKGLYDAKRNFPPDPNDVKNSLYKKGYLKGGGKLN